MNDVSDTFAIDQSSASKNLHLLAMGSEVLDPLKRAIDETRAALGRLTDIANPRVAKRAALLARKLDAFEPSVTLVGQVKAGKTALTNVLIGSAGLLPSDVNPWTSVVTSLHLNSRVADRRTKADFTFFDKNEWANLMVNGGRLGELANRAGASEEMERIQQQVEAMREQTKTRLGKSFELLLGQSHKYGYYDQELIERYVCMGEVDAAIAQPSTKQGRFADITKSAELFIDRPEFPGTLCLRDTPGVNDTFMMREQITLRSLRGSDICLVVLSAHQALNTTDMALVRLISNFEKRQVILFVNRIDELANPREQIPEIRDSILATLKASNAPDDCEIIFGSAKWAEAALTGTLDKLGDDSEAALLNWAEALGEIDADDSDTHAWILSGVPELMRAVNRRILEGSGKRLLESLRSRAANLTSEMAAERFATQEHDDSELTERLEPNEIRHQLHVLVQESEARFETVSGKLRTDLSARMERLQASFVRRATDALIAHLERFGEQDSWQYDATGLRLLIRSAYFQFAASTKKELAGLFLETSAQIETLYTKAVGSKIQGFRIEPPVLPQVPPPVVVGKTIALDLNSGWWRRWMQRRKGFEAFATDYSALIQTEVSSIIQELERTQIAEIFEAMRDTLNEFLTEQRDALLRLSENSQDGFDKLRLEASDEGTEVALGDVMSALERVAA